MSSSRPSCPDLSDFSGVKAVIFDVYHTLLAVHPAPADAENRWTILTDPFFPAPLSPTAAGASSPARPTLGEFDRTCREFIAEAHRLLRARGLGNPEVDWASVVRRAAGRHGFFPASGPDAGSALEPFLIAHAALQRTTTAMPGAAEFLSGLQARGLLAGIASNAQSYTLAELAAAGIPPSRFPPRVCFWSWQQGFSKPDPGVFAYLSTQLATHHGIQPREILMIGDRLDNDIHPAQAAGWRAWHFQGEWPHLHAFTPRFRA